MMVDTVTDYHQPATVPVVAVKPTYPGMHVQRHLTMNAKSVFLKCLTVDGILRAQNRTSPHA